MATNCPKCFAVQNEEPQDIHGKARILEAHQAYLDEKQRKEELEAKQKELEKRISEESDLKLRHRMAEKHIDLYGQIRDAEREVNYWARRTADRITEYYREENQQ